MNWALLLKLLIWTCAAFAAGFCIFIFFMFGDPVTENAHEFQRVAAKVIPILTIVGWIAGCAFIARRRAK